MLWYMEVIMVYYGLGMGALANQCSGSWTLLWFGATDAVVAGRCYGSSRYVLAMDALVNGRDALAKECSGKHFFYGCSW